MNIERLYPIWFLLCASEGAVIGIVTGHGAILWATAGMSTAVLLALLVGADASLFNALEAKPSTCCCRKCSLQGL